VILLEIALQGIRGFPPLARLMLRPGMNVGRVADPLQRRAILDAIYHVLYPDPARANATARLADPQAKDARFALTFFGRDKITYRIVREAASGAMSLHRFDTEQNKYAALTRVAAEAAQYLRVQQQLPDEVGYERLFVFSPEAMPSHGLRAKTRSGSQIATGLGEGIVPSGPGLPAMRPPATRVPSGIHAITPMRGTSAPSPPAGVPRGASGIGSAHNVTNAIVQQELARTGDVPPLTDGSQPAEVAPDLSERIQVLTETLERAKLERAQVARAEAAQVELDALNQRKFELSTRIDRLKALRAEHDKLSEQSRANVDFRDLPKGLQDRLKRLDEMQAKHHQDRQKLIEEQIDLEQKIRQDVVLPLTGDRYFQAGVGLAALFVALAVLLEKPSLALLNVLCLVVAAGAAFRWIGELESHAKLEVKYTTAKDRAQRLDKQFEQDTSALRRMMEKLDISDPRELAERIEGAQKVERQLEIAKDALDRQLEDPQVVVADQELAQIAGRIEALEAVTISVQSVLSAESLDRRVVQLERDLKELEADNGARRQGIQARPRSAPARTQSRVTATPPLRQPSQPPRAPTKEAANLFDFGGGDIGGDDDDDGYGTGYRGGPSKPSGGGGGAGASSEIEASCMSERSPSGVGRGGGTGSLVDAYSGDIQTTTGSLIAPDRSRDLIQTAVDLLQLQTDDLCVRVQKRVGQYLLAFTDQAFDSATFGPRGEMAVIPKGGGEPIGFMDVGSDRLDLVDAALRFSLVEACVAKFKIPLLFDDPFLGFPPQKRNLLSQMFTYLAKMTQVFLLTEREDVSGNEVKW
jgi:hypothetical protein